MKAISLKAREILDSRGVPTVEAVLKTESGLFLGACPSGTSAGRHEAIELRDGGERFFGKGVRKAIANISEKIAPAIVSNNFESQRNFDDLLIKLDGTENKSNLGANATLSVSIAFCRALACENNQELFNFIANSVTSGVAPFMPRPCFNMLEGGKHAGNNLEVQEFMAIPFLESFAENLRAGSEVYYHLKVLLMKNFGETAINTGYESGFAPAFKKTEQAFEILQEAFFKAGYNGKFKIGLDIAASELLHNGKYKINGKALSPENLSSYYINLCKKYPIIFIEDPFGEDDLESWKLFMNHESLIVNHFVVGDDLTTTNPSRIQWAKDNDLCDSVIIKPNQIGTVWEAINAVNLAKSFGWKIIVSHRSGETNDDFIADFSVGVGADFIKTGAPAGGERVAKYNRLLEIEEGMKR